MEHHDIRITPKTDIFFIHSSRTRVKSNKAKKKRSLKLLKIRATAYQSWVKRSKDGQSIKLFTISLKDIKKALKVRKKTDPR